MPLTNADYLANPEPPSPDLVAHFTSLGASPERANRLARFVRGRRIAVSVTKPAWLLAVVCAAWVTYAVWFAFNGVPSTPSFEQMLWPSIGALIIGVVIAIARASGLTTGPFWEPASSIPRELASAPRRAIVPAIRIGGVIGGITFAFIVATAGLMVQDLRDAVWLQRSGVETTGKVIGRRIRSGKSKAYIVHYQYDLGGVVIQNNASVSRSEYEQMTEGTTVPVTYYPANPMVSKPRSRARLVSPMRILAPLFATVGGMLGLWALMTLLMSYAQKQSEAIATRGVAALAQVTKVSGSGASYSYDTNQGVIDARVSFGKQRPAPMPAAGETFVVLYDPDNPRRSMPLAILQDVRFV
jgi:hypothetical protein